MDAAPAAGAIRPVDADPSSSVFGTMGVGMPLGLGAKAACPDRPVAVLHGDGSFAMNAMEFDTWGSAQSFQFSSGRPV